MSRCEPQGRAVEVPKEFGRLELTTGNAMVYRGWLFVRLQAATAASEVCGSQTFRL